jgi:hypothetical protein
MVVLASVRLGKVLRKSDLLNLLEGLQKLFGAIVQFLGGIPKRPKGPDCKSGGLCLHRFESCFPQFGKWSVFLVCLVWCLMAVW